MARSYAQFIYSMTDTASPALVRAESERGVDRTMLVLKDKPKRRMIRIFKRALKSLGWWKP